MMHPATRFTSSAAVAVALALCGCGGPSSGAPGPGPSNIGPSGAPTCADAGTEGARAIVANKVPTPPTDTWQAEVAAALTQACEQDHWSQELITCLADAFAATTGDHRAAGEACDDMFTEDQERGALERLRPLLDAANADEMDEDGMDGDDDEAGGTGQRHPPPSPDSADPCEGGE